MTPAETARAWLADPLGVVLDFETTGWVGYAVEVAIVGMDGGILFEALLNPQAPIEPGAQAVHGIRNDDVALEDTWRDALADINHALAGKNVIAWGAPFDRGVYERESRRACVQWVTHLGTPEPHAPASWRCAMQLWRQHTGARSAVKLDTLVPTADHSALGDARACLEVVRRVAGLKA